MNSFKPGDWVILSNDNCLAQVKETYPDSNKAKLYWPSEESIGVCSEMQYYELWQPKNGEWCWFWKEGIDIPRLRQFISSSSVFGRPITYTVQPDKSTMMSRNYTGIEVYQYCEPFIGQLPTILKD